MEYRIEYLDFDLKVLGKGKVVQTDQAFKTIPTLLEQCFKKDGFMQQLIDMSWEEPKCSLENFFGRIKRSGPLWTKNLHLLWVSDMMERFQVIWKR